MIEILLIIIIIELFIIWMHTWGINKRLHSRLTDLATYVLK